MHHTCAFPQDCESRAGWFICDNVLQLNLVLVCQQNLMDGLVIKDMLTMANMSNAAEGSDCALFYSKKKLGLVTQESSR